MKFTLADKLTLEGLAPDTFEEIKQQLTMPNPKFQEAQKMGRLTRGIDRELLFYETNGDRLICPRGAAIQIYIFCRNQGEKIQIIDKRRSLDPIELSFKGKLRPLQAQAAKDVLARNFGLLESGTGSGKTVMGLYLIAERKQPALIVVHTRELLAQWCDRIEQFLGIPRKEIGIIGGGKFSIGEQLTIATIQTLYKKVNQVVPHIGHLVVDECHRAPSRTFTEAVSAFDCKYMLGLTATPWRRDKLSNVIFWHIGDVTGKIDKAELLENDNLCQAEVHWIQTQFSTLTDTSDYYSLVLSELTENEQRNRLICKTISEESNPGISLIISDRKAHCCEIKKTLSLEQNIEAALLTGSTSKKNRDQIISDLKDGKCKYLIATGQLIGEGFDLPGISSVFLTTPVRFSGRLVQYIGRALRPSPGKDQARIFDFADVLNPVFLHSAKARHQTYMDQGIHTDLEA